MSIFNLFHDAALTLPVNAGDPLTTEHNSDGSTGNVDTELYFGSSDATKQAEANSNPGTDQIALSIVDSDTGNTNNATVMTLASTQAGLDAAVAGDPLNLGTTILGGSANAVPVWVRVNEGAQNVVNWSDLSLQTNQLKVTAI